MAELSLAIPKRWQPASVWLLYVVGLVPAAWTFYLGATDQLGADPVKTFELFLGIWTIRFLILTLAVSPARELFGWNYLRYRRALGLLTFYYALMHFTVYMVLDQAMDIPAVINDVLKRPFIMFGMAALAMLIPLAVTSNNLSIRRLGKNWIWLHRLVYMVLDQAMDIAAVINDVLKRPFIMFGMAALAMLIPLAVTSNNFSIRRLGKNWIWLHRLVYIIAACGALHFALSTKILDLEQYIYVGLIIALILYRSYRPIARNRQKGKGRTRNRAVASVS